MIRSWCLFERKSFREGLPALFGDCVSGAMGLKKEDVEDGLDGKNYFNFFMFINLFNLS